MVDIDRVALDVGWLLHRHLAAFNQATAMAAAAAASDGDGGGDGAASSAAAAAVLLREYKRRHAHPASASPQAEAAHLAQASTALMAALLVGRSVS